MFGNGPQFLPTEELKSNARQDGSHRRARCCLQAIYANPERSQARSLSALRFEKTF